MSRRLADVALVGLFLAVVGLPGVLGLAGGVATAPAHGVPLPFPADQLTAANWPRFPGRFEAFLNDRVGLRRHLLRANAHAKVDWLGVSAARTVQLGRKGWLFLDVAAMYPPTADVAELPPELRARAWAAMLDDRRCWLADRGIGYLFVSVPEKPSVYPEFLPRLPRHHPQPTVAEGMRRQLRRWPDFPLVDVGAALRREKEPGRLLFHRHDTHWTPEGAFRSYREVASALGLRPLPPGACATALSRHEGDLARLTGWGGSRSEEFVNWGPADRRGRLLERDVAQDESIHEPVAMTARAHGTGDPGQPRAVMFHDSFTQSLYDYLGEHFQRIVFAPTWGFDVGLIERERPAVVVQEAAERAQEARLPRDPLGVRGYRLASRFPRFRLEKRIDRACFTADIDGGSARCDSRADVSVTADRGRIYLVRATYRSFGEDGELRLDAEMVPRGPRDGAIRRRVGPGRGEETFVIGYPHFTGRMELVADNVMLEVVEVRSADVMEWLE